MEKISNQMHSKETFLYATSRTLERASYYGLRSLIVLYMISEVLKMEDTEALSIYGWFTASLVFSQIVGAVLGDLLIGNKRALIIGGILQSLGAFMFCIPSTTGLYIGIILVVLGGGLYTPNLVSNFGKLYLNKTKLLDAGFATFYLAVNLGAFFGIFAIGYLGDEYGWNAGFIAAGILMLLSIMPILYSKHAEIESRTENKTAINSRIIKISIALVFVGLFWAIYEISNIRIFDLQSKLSEISSLDIPKSIWSSFNSFFILPVSLLAIFLWTYFYSTQFFKLMIGFIFGAISFGILFLIPETPDEHHTVLYITSLFFLGISEIHIAPIIYSVLTQYANPKYLAILISLAFLPTKLFSFIVGLFYERLYVEPIFAILLSMIAMAILGGVLIIYNLTHKKTPLIMTQEK